jgi:hypothetical protein
MRYARTHDANYLVVRDYKLPEYRPQLASVVQKGTPDLELLFTFEESHITGSVRTLVYHISSTPDK